jgi:hypothetical protein
MVHCHLPWPSPAGRSKARTTSVAYLRGRRVLYRRTDKHKTEVLWFHVRAARFQAMRRRHAKTHFVRPKASVDASLYFFAKCTHERLVLFADIEPAIFARKP